MVRARRAQLGLTQEALAEAAGVGLRTIRDVEAGRIVRPRPSTVRQLADTFGLRSAERDSFLTAALLTGSRDPGPQPHGANGWVNPAQLPMDVPGFIGRSDELRVLSELLGAEAASSTVPIAALSGTAGVGKTALAVHWAHLVRDQFPDGQLYVNLRGFDAGPAMDPAEGIRTLLDALQVAPERCPDTLDAQAALYRSMIAGRRVLILLDNARDSDQVRHLLPGAPGALVIVTSRNQLTGLVAASAARPLSLDVLSVDEAQQFLVGRLGVDRVAAEPQAVQEIIACCARLPLALAIVAARAGTAPHLSLATLAAHLLDSRDLLDTLTTDAPIANVRALFSWSYHTLGVPPARLFRLLGLHPGTDVSVSSAASLTALSPPQARSLLTELTRTNLLTEHAPGRYGFHDLLRTYARELVRGQEADDLRRAATGRLLDHYLHTAYAADRLLDPHRDPIPLPACPQTVTIPHLADRPQSLAWFAIERPGLVAAISLAAGSGFDTHAWCLSWASTTFLQRQQHWDDWLFTQRVAVAAAERLGDARAAAEAHRGLGRACIATGSVDDGECHLRHAWTLFGELGRSADQAHVSLCLSRMFLNQRHQRSAAINHTQHALHLARAAGHLRWQAAALNCMGWYQLDAGEVGAAIASCCQAVEILHEVGDPVATADTLHSLGYARQLLGQHRQAEESYQHARQLYRELGDRYHEAGTLVYLGDNHHAAGDVVAAHRFWRQALPMLEDLAHPDAAAVSAKLRAAPVPAAGR